jgi:electron transport complex protein RnfC
MSAARSRTFRHGVHPPEHKEDSCGVAIERLPFVREYVLPLSQHLGAPSKSVVKVGQRVRRGQVIAEPAGFVSVALHAPVTGTIQAIDLRMHPNGKMMPSIVIETDPYDSQRLPEASPIDPMSLDGQELVQRIQQGGLVGLGGAAFPSHVKLQVPADRRVEFVMINGCECEPYLTCDDRLMLERTQDVVRGAEIIQATVGAKRVYIGIESNKPDAVAAMSAAALPDMEVISLPVKYPQGAEKLLIDAVLGKEVPMGGLPLDIEIVVHNVGTAVAIVDLFERGIPVIERVLTVTGPAVVHPRNLLVPLGTPVSAVIERCGGLRDDVHHVVLGGPMMGMALKSLDVPTIKGASGILCLDRASAVPSREWACIRCGRCVEACPMFLNPTRLVQLVRGELMEELEPHHLMNCFECASCSYVCPSRLPLVQLLRMGKIMLREWKASQ